MGSDKNKTQFSKRLCFVWQVRKFLTSLRFAKANEQHTKHNQTTHNSNMVNTKESTAPWTATLKFTTDLPNGPYVTEQSQNHVIVHINQNATVQEVKNIIENYAKELLARQAEDVKNKGMGEMESKWTIESISYKGGKVPLNTSLETMHTDDQLALIVHSVISVGSSCVIA